MELIIFILVAYGMTTILVYGSIFNGLRDKIHQWGSSDYAAFNYLGKFISELIKCMLCTSTWVGFFLSLTFFSPITHFIGHNEFFYVFFDGMLSAGSVWALNSVIEWFEENRPVSNVNNDEIIND